MNKWVGMLVMISCVTPYPGCAVPVDDEVSSEAREVGQATAELSNCSVFNRVEAAAPPGQVGLLGFVADQPRQCGLPGDIAEPMRGPWVLL